MGRLINTVTVYKTRKINKPRYRELQINEEYYLIDLDANPLLWFFPGIVGLFPMKAQKINQRVVIKEKRAPQVKVTVGLVTPIATMLIFRFFPKDAFIFSKQTLLLIILLTQLILFCTKLLISRMFKLSYGEKYTLKIYSSNLTSFYKQVLPGLIGFLLLYFWLVSEFLRTGSILVFFTTIGFNALLLYFHNLMHMPLEVSSVEIKENQ